MAVSCFSDKDAERTQKGVCHWTRNLWIFFQNKPFVGRCSRFAELLSGFGPLLERRRGHPGARSSGLLPRARSAGGKGEGSSSTWVGGVCSKSLQRPPVWPLGVLGSHFMDLESAGRGVHMDVRSNSLSQDISQVALVRSRTTVMICDGRVGVCFGSPSRLPIKEAMPSKDMLLPAKPQPPMVLGRMWSEGEPELLWATLQLQSGRPMLISRASA